MPFIDEKEMEYKVEGVGKGKVIYCNVMKFAIVLHAMSWLTSMTLWNKRITPIPPQCPSKRVV